MMSELWRDLKILRLLALKVGPTGPKTQVTLKGKETNVYYVIAVDLLSCVIN